MQESQTLDHLLHVALDLIRREPDLWVVKQAIEIMLTVLEDQVDGTLLAVVIRRFGGDNLLQFDDAGMVEFCEQLNFADGSDWELSGPPGQSRQISGADRYPDLDTQGQLGYLAGLTPSFSLHIFTFLSATTSPVSLLVALYTVLLQQTFEVGCPCANDQQVRRQAQPGLSLPVSPFANYPILLVIVKRLHIRTTMSSGDA